MFKMLSEGVPKSPKYFACDFELATIISALNVFKGVTIQACFFHFAQSLWRNLSSKGLTGSFSRKNSAVRRSFYHMKSLAFVPESDVIKGFKIIKAKSPATFKSMIDYFEKNYIGDFQKGFITIRKIPRFPIHMWNVLFFVY